jgi:hypothetical protein
METDQFYPERGQPSEIDEEFCFLCPVRLQCLNWAMREHHGIWGAWRAEWRNWARRRDRSCPWCSASIERFTPVMFCRPECEAAAVTACGEEAERLEKELDEMRETARLAISQAKGRRLEPAEGAPRQGALW